MGSKEIDGYETASRIRDHEKKIQINNASFNPVTIIVHSGDDAKTIQQKLKVRTEVDGFTTKPIKSDLMQKALQSLISRLSSEEMRESLIKLFSQEARNDRGRPRF